jgi:hypothetical protein
VDEQQLAREQQFEAGQRQARVEELAKIEEARQTHERTLEAGQKALLGLQRQRNEQWSSFIHTNWPAYQALRQSANDATNHTAHCTLCDGGGTFRFCILCEGSGVCPACQGSGKSADGAPCPVCFAKGTCSLCLGTRHMPCPFCDDGTVYASLAAPPASLPVFGTAASRPSLPKPIQLAQTPPSPVVAQTNSIQESDSPEVAGTEPASPPRHRSVSVYAAATVPGLAHQELQIAAVFILATMILLLRLRAWFAAHPRRRPQAST